MVHYPSLARSFNPVGLGCASLSGEGGGYGFGDVSETQAEALVKTALEQNISIFDTAPIYGFGLSEERLGRLLKSNDEAFIITKGGIDWDNSRRVHLSNDPKVIERMLHESLKRLKRDRIDMYLIHWPDPKVDIRRPLEVLLRAREQSKIRFIGLANTNAEDLQKSKELTELDGFQAQHNLWHQDNFALIADQAERALFTGWGTFDKGILTGRVSLERTYEASDVRSSAPWWNKTEIEEKLERLKTLKALSDPHELTLSEVSLLFALTSLSPGVVLVGSKTPQDLQEVIRVSQKTQKIPTVKNVIEEWKRLHK